MKNYLSILFALAIFSSCLNEDLTSLEVQNDNIEFQSKKSFYQKYSDDVSYTLDDFLRLDHNEYGYDFIDEHIDGIVNNLSRISKEDLDDIASSRAGIKFRFRWNICDPLGACLLIPIRMADPGDSDLTECLVGVVEDQLVVIPLGPRNGMLSDGYIFVDPIEIGKEACDDLGIPYGSEIKPGIYKSSLPSEEFKYGYHVLDLIK